MRDASAQVETLLKGQDPDPNQRPSPPQLLENTFNAPLGDEPIMPLPDLSDLGELGGFGGDMDNSFQSQNAPGAGQMSQSLFVPAQHTGPSGNSQWDLISLGLEEPLPSQDVIEELYVICAVSIWKLFHFSNSRHLLVMHCSLRRFIP